MGSKQRNSRRNYLNSKWNGSLRVNLNEMYNIKENALEVLAA